MKVQCPKCARTLAVADEYAGRRVKCPGCQGVFRLPASENVALAPAPAAALPADLPPADAVQQVAAPARKARGSCPECGEPLAAGETECPECGWSSGRPSRRAAAEGVGGGCYVFIRNDEVDLNEAVEKRVRKLLETERLDIALMGEYDEPPERLGPDDLVISGKVTRWDYGSRTLRYLLPIVALIGPGSSRLEAEAEVETAGGSRRIKARSRLWAGFFGGSNAGFMKRNVQIVAGRIADGAARLATKRRFLNAQAYGCANWSLGLGVASLLPFAGVPFGLIGLVLAIVALVTIGRRRLPRGRGAAIAGLLLPFVGFLATAGAVLLLSNN